MRLIGIGLLTFVVAGVAIILSQLDLGAGLPRQELVFDPRLQAIMPGSAPSASVRRSDPDEVILLSGFPSYGRAVFHLPVDARPTAGSLELDLTTQAAAETDGTLRVALNGARRGEVVLRPGDRSHALRIPLTGEELAQERLVVTFNAQGRTMTDVCDADGTHGMVVAIEPTSRLELTLDQPLDTARDRLLAAGLLARAAWPEREEQPQHLALAAGLRHRGIPVVFDGAAEHGLETAALRELAALDLREVAGPVERVSRRPDIGPDGAWLLPIAREGANAGARRFTRSTTWRHRFDLGELPGQTHATALDLALTLGPLPAGATWTVTTTLNGRIAQLATVAADGAPFARRVPLPEAFQEAANLLEVTAVSSHVPEGICRGAPELVAEMGETTRLVGGGARLADPLAALRERLRAFEAAHLVVRSPLSPAEATLGARLLAALAPAALELRPEQPAEPLPTLTVMPRADAAELERMATGGGRMTRWVVLPDGGSTTGLRLAPLEAGLARQLRARSPLAVLVELPAGHHPADEQPRSGPYWASILR